MKKIFSLLFITITSVIYCQEVVATFPIKLKRNKEVFQIIDKNTQDVALFLTDKNDVTVLKFSKDFILLDSITAERPDKNFETISGYTESENSKQIFWTSGNGKEIARQNIDFKNKSNDFKVYNIDNKKEIKLFEFSANNQFFLVTILKKSSLLTFHVFDNLGNKTEKVLDLTSTEFFNSTYSYATLYDMYNENFLPAEASFPVQKISSESQVSLTSASKKRKYYVEDSMLYMTFDNTHFQTQMLAISLNDFQYKKTNFRQPIIREGNISRIEANSFLYKNQLFQIKSTFDYLIILIKDLDGKLLKEYKISKDEEISFKNSEIIQLGSDFGPTVRTINTNQFLRKVSNLNPGISCYELDGKTLLTIGSVSEAQNNNALLGGMLFGLSGYIITYMITNPVFDNFNSYANRKVVYFNSFLEDDFTHSNKILEKTAFDKMELFYAQNKKAESETAFKINKDYYFGFYNSYKKEYSILKFQE